MSRRKKTISSDIQHLYLMMNKPCGYVCSSVSDRSPVVFDLIPDEYKLYCVQNNLSLHTVGRLDKDTSGLLLFTTDGQFSHRLTSPENHVEKIYEVVLKEKESAERQKQIEQRFSKGIILPAEKKSEEQQALPSNIEWISASVCRLTISEGKFHQVRRMFLAVGNEVSELKRLTVGTYLLPKDLEPGNVVQVSMNYC